jgi:hypothetical protein
MWTDGKEWRRLQEWQLIGPNHSFYQSVRQHKGSTQHTASLDSRRRTRKFFGGHVCYHVTRDGAISHSNRRDTCKKNQNGRSPTLCNYIGSTRSFYQSVRQHPVGHCDCRENSMWRHCTRRLSLQGFLQQQFFWGHVCTITSLESGPYLTQHTRCHSIRLQDTGQNTHTPLRLPFPAKIPNISTTNTHGGKLSHNLHFSEIWKFQKWGLAPKFEIL